MAHMKGHDYWPEWGEPILSLVDDILAKAKVHGYVIVRHGAEGRTVIERDMTPAEIRSIIERAIGSRG